jgi:uncharacterized OB-fold protein
MATRPVPVVRGADEPFWRAAREERLVYQWCAACQQTVFPGRIVCPHCLAPALEWRTSSGRGTVYSYTVVRRSRHPYFAARCPYVVALVDMAEGFRLLATLEASPDAVSVGMPVRARFEPLGDAFGVPVFLPDSDGSPVDPSAVDGTPPAGRPRSSPPSPDHND